MKPHHIIIAELVLLAVIVYRARSEPTATATLRLPSGAMKLMDPKTVRRSTGRGPNPVGTVGAVTFKEGGGLY